MNESIVCIYICVCVIIGNLDFKHIFLNYFFIEKKKNDILGQTILFKDETFLGDQI